jgi:hypothetical protein
MKCKNACFSLANAYFKSIKFPLGAYKNLVIGLKRKYLQVMMVPAAFSLFGLLTIQLFGSTLPLISKKGNLIKRKHCAERACHQLLQNLHENFGPYLYLLYI